MGEDVRVQTQVAGTGCETTPLYTECTNNGLDCGENEYCQYLEIKVEGQYTEGVCTACPTLENGEPNPSGCFFSQDDYINFHFNPDFVKSCATSCHASLGKSVVVFLTKTQQLFSKLILWSSSLLSPQPILCTLHKYNNSANGESKFSTTDISVIDFGVDNKEDQVSYPIIII